MAEGATLERLYTGNCIVSSNLTVSADQSNESPISGIFCFKNKKRRNRSFDCDSGKRENNAVNLSLKL